MRPEWLFTSSSALTLLVLLSFAASFASHWRTRVRQRRELAGLRAELEARQASSAQAFTSLRQGLEALDEVVRTPPEPPRAGGLNRSARAQALSLLRSGMSPESAAAALGMAKREMRLLERVSQTLYVR